MIAANEETPIPSGHASHKGTSDKPNVNAASVHSAADKSMDPEDALPEGAVTNTVRTQEFVDFPPAVERPDSPSNNDKHDKQQQG